MLRSPTAGCGMAAEDVSEKTHRTALPVVCEKLFLRS